MYVKVDAKQLEWRVAVWLSRDKVGIDEINSGADIHLLNQGAFNLPTRLISKKYLFRTIFRGSGYAFAMDNEFKHVSTDPDFWDGVNEKFYKKYKDLDAWHQKLAQTVAAGKPIVSPLGREWMIPLGKDGKLPWTVLTNSPVQGTGHDVMSIGRISLRNRLKANGLKSLMVSTVHDDIKLDCPDHEVDQVVEITHSVFNDIPKNFKKLYNVDLPIPFPGETFIGTNLGDMEEYGNP